MIAQKSVVPLRIAIVALACGCFARMQLLRADSAPIVKWVFQTGGRIYSSPVVADLSDSPGLEVLFVSSAERQLMCLCPPDRILWTYDGFHFRNTSTPTVVDRTAGNDPRILIGSRQPGVVCLDGKGALRWQQPLSDGLPWASITVADANRDGKPEAYWMDRLGCVECRGLDGERLWQHRIDAVRPGDRVDSSVAVGDVNGDGRDEIVVPGPHFVVCLRSDGTQMWTIATVSRFEGGPVIADVLGDERPEILLGSLDGLLYCLEGGTGRILWNHRTFQSRVCTSVAVGDIDRNGLRRILYGDGVGDLYCLDGSGTERWTFRSGGWIESVPALGDVDGDERIEVVCGSEDGNVYCLSADGRRKWAFNAGSRVSASPTLCDYDRDGVIDILIAAHNGRLYCLSCGGRWSAKAVLWPCKRYDIWNTGCLPPD